MKKANKTDLLKNSINQGGGMKRSEKKGVGKKLLARIEILANQVAQIIRNIAKFMLL